MIDRILFSTVGSVLALAALPARAEFPDYGALESAFGEAVTTSATGKPQKSSDVPLSMTIIDAEKIKRSAAVDIPGILREYTDLDVLQWGNGSSDVSARGYDSAWSSRMLVLINGRQVYQDYRGFTDWAALPVQLQEIRQIEVVKGPNSALFGFNAAGGVINIVTFNPAYDKVNQVTARYGSGAYKEVNGAATYQFGQGNGLRLSAGGSDVHAFGTTSETTPNGSNVNPEKRAVNFEGIFNLAEKLQGGVEASYNENTLFQFTDLGLGSATRTKVGSLKGSLSADTDFGVVDAMIYRNDTLVDAVNPVGGPDIHLRNPLNVFKVQDLVKVGKDHTLRFGAEYRNESLDSLPVQGLKINSSTASVSGMWDWAITPQVNWTNAVRYDHFALERTGTPIAGMPVANAAFDRTFDKVSANSGVVYRVTDIDSVRAAFGRGLQLPSLAQYAGQGGVPFVVGNPYLQPTIVTNYEIGYAHDFTDVGARLNTALFIENNQALATIAPNGAVFPASTAYANIGDSVARGGEIGVDGKMANSFRYGGTWRYELIEDHLSVNNSSGGNLAYPVDYAHSAPHHLLTARAGYTLYGVDLDLFARYSTGYRIPGTVAGPTIKDYSIPEATWVDMRAAYALTDNVELAVHGLGFTQKNTVLTSGPAVERQVFGTINVKF